jgi:hypothetical protein
MGSVVHMSIVRTEERKIEIIQGLLTSNNIMINKALIKNIGTTPATLFTVLCHKQEFCERNKLLYRGHFEYSYIGCKRELGLHRTEQDIAIRILTELGLVETMIRTVKNDSKKRYFKITDNIRLVNSFLKENL